MATGVIAKLAAIKQTARDSQERDRAAVDFAQAYMESRGYLRTNSGTGDREIHGVAAWALLALQNNAGQTADPADAEYPVLIRFGHRALELNNALTAGTDITQIIADYKDLQDVAEEIDKRELVIARVSARMALIPLTAERDTASWSIASDIGTAPSVSSILREAGMDTSSMVAGFRTRMDAEWWQTLYGRIKSSGSLFLPWGTLKNQQWQSGSILGLGRGGVAIFGDDAKLVQEAVDTDAAADEW